MSTPEDRLDAWITTNPDDAEGPCGCGAPKDCPPCQLGCGAPRGCECRCDDQEEEDFSRQAFVVERNFGDGWFADVAYVEERRAEDAAQYPPVGKVRVVRYVPAEGE